MRTADQNGFSVKKLHCPRALPAAGIALASMALFVTGLGLVVASRSLLLEVLGATVLAFNLVQWFVVMHECGHGTLFPWRVVNTALGHFAGFLTGFPFHAWRTVHHQHHVWTGWKDKDPTTARAAPRNLPLWQRRVVDFCWRGHIPLFMFIYRFDNFWNARRLGILLRDKRFANAVALNALVLVCLYAAIAFVLPARTSLTLLAASLLFNMLIEPVMLSQHTHIPQRLSLPGVPTTPFAPADQVVFTRSAYFPRPLSTLLLFHFDRHEAHHASPAAPCYVLPKLDDPAVNGMSFLCWWRESRRLRGHELLFKSRDETGAPL